MLDVPPGTGRTVTAEAFDVNLVNTFEGTATGVTVLAGTLTDVSITLRPLSAGTSDVNTPPHFTSVTFPASILANATANLSATAGDPDPGTALSYTWTVNQGGGTFAPASHSNRTPGTAATTVYTPLSGFTGYAVVAVAATDGTATTTTTFPIAVGSGVNASISFDTSPDLTVSGVDRQLSLIHI